MHIRTLKAIFPAIALIALHGCAPIQKVDSFVFGDKCTDEIASSNPDIRQFATRCSARKTGFSTTAQINGGTAAVICGIFPDSGISRESEAKKRVIEAIGTTSFDTDIKGLVRSESRSSNCDDPAKDCSNLSSTTSGNVTATYRGRIDMNEWRVDDHKTQVFSLCNNPNGTKNTTLVLAIAPLTAVNDIATFRTDLQRLSREGVDGLANRSRDELTKLRSRMSNSQFDHIQDIGIVRNQLIADIDEAVRRSTEMRRVTIAFCDTADSDTMNKVKDFVFRQMPGAYIAGQATNGGCGYTPNEKIYSNARPVPTFNQEMQRVFGVTVRTGFPSYISDSAIKNTEILLLADMEVSRRIAESNLPNRVLFGSPVWSSNRIGRGRFWEFAGQRGTFHARAPVATLNSGQHIQIVETASGQDIIYTKIRYVDDKGRIQEGWTLTPAVRKDISGRGMWSVKNEGVWITVVGSDNVARSYYYSRNDLTLRRGRR